MDSLGYDCSSNVGYDCLNMGLFLEWGYSRDDWLNILMNCASSCGFDCASETCDASDLLKNAYDVGDCSVGMASGMSCTNTPVEGFTCTTSTCVYGILLAGACEGSAHVVDVMVFEPCYYNL